jgi:hypothetical protein
MNHNDDSGDLVATDTFEVPAQDLYVIAGHDVPKPVWDEYQRVAAGSRPDAEQLVVRCPSGDYSSGEVTVGGRQVLDVTSITWTCVSGELAVAVLNIDRVPADLTAEVFIDRDTLDVVDELTRNLDPHEHHLVRDLRRRLQLGRSDLDA